MNTTEKTALCLGLYGALLSTWNAAIQLITYRKERTNVHVRVQDNMVSTDRMTERYTIITAVNRGKRPVRIEGFAARQLDTKTALLFPDVRPRAPHTLEEAQSIRAWILNGHVLDKIETYFAYDSLGREFTCHRVSWLRRQISQHNRKRELLPTKEDE